MTLELDRRTVIVSTLGLVVLACLLFIAGMVVAVRWYLPTFPREGGEVAEPVASGSLRGASLTGSRATTPRWSPPRASAPKLVGPRLTPPKVTGPRVVAPRVTAGRTSTALPSDAGGATEAAEAGDASAAPPSSGRGDVLEDAFAVAVDEAASSYAVQVGAFRSPFNVENLILELQDRGYQPYVVRIEVNGTVLHTVRIGLYSNADEATDAAASFYRREGIAAVVRVAPQQNLG